VNQEAEEDIGEAYQDESNQAALLLHHDKSDGSLLMVSQFVLGTLTSC